jgi:hypothetical protein
VNLFASDRSKPVYRKNQDSDRQPGVLLRSLSASQAETSTACDSDGPVVGAARPEPHTERGVQGTATAALHHLDRFVRDGTATRFTAARLEPAFATPRLPQNFSAARSAQKIGRSSSTRVATVSGGNATDTEPEKGPAGALRRSVVEKELSLRLPATSLSRTGCTDRAALPENACVPHPLAKEISGLRAMYFPALTVAFLIMFGSCVVLWRSHLSTDPSLVFLVALVTVFCASRCSLTTTLDGPGLPSVVEVTHKEFPDKLMYGRHHLNICCGVQGCSGPTAASAGTVFRGTGRTATARIGCFARGVGLAVILGSLAIIPGTTAGDVNLATWTKPGLGFDILGAAQGASAGQSVADAGDVNDDTYQDILVGAPDVDSGSVYLVFGSPGRSITTIDTASALSSNGIKISGTGGDSGWGRSVSGAGDVNKDGIDDFVIGGFQYDPSLRSNAGASVVIFGKTSGWTDVNLASFSSGSAGFWIYGAVAGDTCGFAVGGAGDVNGDGADDVITAAPLADGQNRLDAGITYLIFGHSTATAFNTIDLSTFTSGSAGFKIFGATAGDGSGWAVSGAGDINHDGFDDVIVGSYQYDGPAGDRSNCGAAYVLFGHSTATAFTDIDLAALPSSQGFRITGAAASNQLGYSVSSAGDFNNDGYVDMVVGSRVNKAYILFGHSNATLFQNVDLVTFVSGTAGFTVSGSGFLGTVVSGGADANNDGVDDIVIAAPSFTSTGAAYVLYGRDTPAFSNINVLTGLPSVSGYRIVGTASTGWYVDLVRDFDGDGIGDVLIGARVADPPGRTDAGTAYLVYGELSSPTSQPTGQPSNHPQINLAVHRPYSPACNQRCSPQLYHPLSQQASLRGSRAVCHPASQARNQRDSPQLNRVPSPQASQRGGRAVNPPASQASNRLSSPPYNRAYGHLLSPRGSQAACRPANQVGNRRISPPRYPLVTHLGSRPGSRAVCRPACQVRNQRGSHSHDPVLSPQANQVRDQLSSPLHSPALDHPLSPRGSRAVRHPANLRDSRVRRRPASLVRNQHASPLLCPRLSRRASPRASPAVRHRSNRACSQRSIPLCCPPCSRQGSPRASQAVHRLGNLARNQRSNHMPHPPLSHLQLQPLSHPDSPLGSRARSLPGNQVASRRGSPPRHLHHSHQGSQRVNRAMCHLGSRVHNRRVSHLWSLLGNQRGSQRVSRPGNQAGNRHCNLRLYPPLSRPGSPPASPQGNRAPSPRVSPHKGPRLNLRGSPRGSRAGSRRCSPQSNQRVNRARRQPASQACYQRCSPLRRPLFSPPVSPRCSRAVCPQASQVANRRVRPQ